MLCASLGLATLITLWGLEKQGAAAGASDRAHGLLVAWCVLAWLAASMVLLESAIEVRLALLPSIEQVWNSPPALPLFPQV